MTTTQILDDIRDILVHDYPTVKSVEKQAGFQSSFTTEFGVNTFFRVIYKPNKNKFTEIDVLDVDIFHNIPVNGKARWFIDNTVLTAYKRFIEGAFPLLYAERFAEVCEIEAEEEAEADREALERDEAWEELQFRMSHQEY